MAAEKYKGDAPKKPGAALFCRPESDVLRHLKCLHVIFRNVSH